MTRPEQLHPDDPKAKALSPEELPAGAGGLPQPSGPSPLAAGDLVVPPLSPEEEAASGDPQELASGRAYAVEPELPPLVQVSSDGSEVLIDFKGAIDHIPESLLNEAERASAINQVRQRVGQIMAERVAHDLADEVMAVTAPEPAADEVETAGGGVATVPPAVP